MQQYQGILANKELQVEQLSKPLQKQIADYETNLDKYNSLNELIETDQIEDDKINDAKTSLAQYLEILKDSDAEICKKLNKFDLDVYTKNAANLAKGRKVNSKTNGSKKGKKIESVVPVVNMTAPAIAANQGTQVATTQQTTPNLKNQTEAQFEATTADGKKLEITEEKHTEKKGMPTWGKVVLGIGLAVATFFGGKAIVDEINNNN